MFILAGLLIAVISLAAFALLRAVILCVPVALVSGQVHEHLAWVPNLDWKTSFWVVLLLGLLIPVGNSTSSDS